jgi:predicted ATP-grasp superfamily ATP-dependent carboligase
VVSRRILVTDGDQRSALACVRSLGRAGHECFVLGPKGGGGLAARSRYCVEGADVIDAGKDPEGFLAAVDDSVRRWGIDTLFPMTEKTLRVVLPRRSIYERRGVLLPFPDADTFQEVSDKARVLKAAGELGIPVPRQWIWRDLSEADTAAVPPEAFPLAVKPTRSVGTSGRSGETPSVQYMESPAVLAEWAAQAGPESFPALAQERIIGEGVGVFLLVWEDELRAAVGHRRIREKPPSGGVSAVRESTDPDPELLERSLGLLGSMGWRSGVAMVEYKVRMDTGVPVLMEINGRFWGSLQLAIDAGVDFPVLLLEAAQEGKGAPRGRGSVVRGRPGVKTRWLLGDLDQLLLRLFRTPETLSLPPGHPGRLRAISEFLADFRPGVRLEVLRWEDPCPFLAEAATWLRALR